jgi:hypothetical protein
MGLVRPARPIRATTPRRCLCRKVTARSPRQQLLFQVLIMVDEPQIPTTADQRLLSRQRRHRHALLEVGAVPLPLYTHVSRPFWSVILRLK